MGTYFICGGGPLYLREFDPSVSVETNVRQRLLSEHALVHRELRELRRNTAILTVLARGSLSGREIAAQTGLEPRGLGYYLDQLEQLTFVRRRYPLTGRRPSARVGFAIEDPLLRFWFRAAVADRLRHGDEVDGAAAGGLGSLGAFVGRWGLRG